jgi:hypothetical protein
MQGRSAGFAVFMAGATLLAACAGSTGGSAPPVAPQTGASASTTPPPTPSPTRPPGPSHPRPPSQQAPPAQRPPAGGGFPTPRELEQLGAAPLPDDVFSLDIVAVDTWRLEGPFPERVGALPHSADDPWTALLEEVARERAGLVLPTEGMACVARELGRFYLAHRGRPSDRLRRFMTARCHTAVSQVAFGYVDGPVPSQQGEAQVYGHWRDAVAETIRRGVGGGPRSAGIWFGRRDGHAVAMVAYGSREVHVEPFSPFADRDGKLVIAGEALGPAVRIAALVNRGRFDVAPCDAAPEVLPPRFHFTCEVDGRDLAAAIAVSVTPPDRLLSRGGLAVLAWPGERTLDVYDLPGYTEARLVSDPERVPERFVELLNQVRREAGLAPVALDPVQTRAATELAPHFFAALFDRTPGLTADLVVLGMLAGWSVEGLVQSGHFAAAWAVRTNDLSALLGTALESPVSREALLADDIDRIAVGPLLETASGQEALAAVFGTYSLFTEEAHDQVAERVYAKLEADRRARGVGAPARLDALAGLCQQTAGRVQAGEDPADAMNLLLRSSVDALQAPVSGWVAEVREIDEIEFPEEYQTSPTLRVGIAVSYSRREDDPWGHYVVMLVVSDPEAWGA